MVISGFKFFGTSLQEVSEKTRNIFIGISLGNKFIPDDIARQLLLFSLNNTKTSVLVLIADEIDAVNWRIFRKYTDVGARRSVLRVGQALKRQFSLVADRLPLDVTNGKAVRIVTWTSILDSRYTQIRQKIELMFENDVRFREQILKFVRMYAQRRQKNLNTLQEVAAASYIISEIPTILVGVNYDGSDYTTILYPTFIESGMSDFIIDIQNGKFGPYLLEFRDQFATMVEAYVAL